MTHMDREDIMAEGTKLRVRLALMLVGSVITEGSDIVEQTLTKLDMQKYPLPVIWDTSDETASGEALRSMT